MPEVRKPIQRMIAAAMASEINADSLFGPILRAEQVADPKRRLQELREGEMIVDCIGQGARFTPRNRRDGDRTYIVWVAVHMKLRDGVVTNDALDESGYWAQQVQEFFHDPEHNEVVLESGERAVLGTSEPFPLSREALFGHGLHMSTYSFEWSMVR
jgi:hypothetical protein